jgi:hypothetical protein
VVKLDSWDEINKAVFQRHLSHVISATEMKVFRLFEGVFSGKDKYGEVHQCGNCGDIFYLGKDVKEKVTPDWLGNPVCPKCGKFPGEYEDKEWRRKFTAFHNITEAQRRFEESEPDQRIVHLKEIRNLSKEFYQFKTVAEMYSGYYRLMKELQQGENEAPALKPEWKAVIDSLFENAKANNFIEFVKLVFSQDPLISRQIFDTIWESQTAIVRMEKDYFLSKVSDYPILQSPVTIESIENSRIRFSLLLYNHLVELSPLYEITINLVRVSQGKLFAKESFPKSAKYRPRALDEKIGIINRENPELGSIFNYFWVRQVRNAFSHSKYKIEKGFFIKTDENFKISIPELQAKIDVCKDYWWYLSGKCAKEQLFLQEKKVIKTKNGDTLTVSTDSIPENL